MYNFDRCLRKNSRAIMSPNFPAAAAAGRLILRGVKKLLRGPIYEPVVCTQVCSQLRRPFGTLLAIEPLSSRETDSLLLAAAMSRENRRWITKPRPSQTLASECNSSRWLIERRNDESKDEGVHRSRSCSPPSYNGRHRCSAWSTSEFSGTLKSADLFFHRVLLSEGVK